MNRIRPSLIVFMLLLSAGVFALNACGDPQKKGPQETAEAFLNALQNGDYETAKTFCTPGTKNSLDAFQTFSGLGANPFSGDYQILNEEISGEYALISYTTGDPDDEGDEKFIRLRKTTGKWEVMASKTDMTVGKKKEDIFNLDLGGSDEEDDESSEDDGDPADVYRAAREGKSVEEVADAFLTAMMFTDYEEAYKYSSRQTKKALKLVKSVRSLSSEGIDMQDFKIVRVEEKGKYAKVYYTEKGSDDEQILKMSKDKHGNWQSIMDKSDMDVKVERDSTRDRVDYREPL